MKAIIYVRVSTEDQARHGYSLPAQIEACQKKAESLGVIDTVIISDEGVTGSILDRPGLTKAREHIKSGVINFFICLDPDRLARNLSHQLLITEELEKRGTKLEFVNFDWQDTPEGKLFYSLRGAIAEYEKEKIKERSRRGKLQKAKQGKLTHNPRIFGYRYFNGNLSINHDEAEIVKFIFQLCLQGNSPYHIANKLNEQGIPSPGKKSWHRATVCRILRNQTYTGRLFLNRYNTEGLKQNKYKPKGEKLRPTFRPRQDWIPVAVPVIIDETDFQLTQKNIAMARALHPGNRKYNYLLSGLVRCGRCGKSAHGSQINKPNGKVFRYYVCGNRSRRHDGFKCDLPMIKADLLESIIWSRVKDWLLDEKCLQAELYSLTNGNLGFKPEILDRTVQDMEKAVLERNRVLKFFQKGHISEQAAEESLAEIEMRLQRLETSKQVLLKQAVSPSPLDKEIQVQELAKAYPLILEALDFDHRRSIVQALIDGIQVDTDGIIISAHIAEMPHPN